MIQIWHKNKTPTHGLDIDNSNWISCAMFDVWQPLLSCLQKLVANAILQLKSRPPIHFHSQKVGNHLRNINACRDAIGIGSLVNDIEIPPPYLISTLSPSAACCLMPIFICPAHATGSDFFCPEAFIVCMRRFEDADNKCHYEEAFLFASFYCIDRIYYCEASQLAANDGRGVGRQIMDKACDDCTALMERDTTLVR